MSKPLNILSNYRSYSYHHILIACDNEASAKKIRSSNSLSTFRQLRSPQPVSLSTTDESTGKKIQTDIGHYVVILNGMIDTSFIIKDVSWFTTSAASTIKNDRFTSLAVEGKMTVEEPRGVNFLNELNGACDSLRSDPTGVIWMLKTIFVGHKDNSEVDYIVNLLPLEFMMYDVTGTFDNTGGTYEISFAGVSNGAARFPQFSTVAQTVHLRVQETLKATISLLEQKINGNSRRNRICVIGALKKAYSEFTTSDLEEFREVQYRIIVEPPYDDPKYIIDGLSDQEKDVAIRANNGANGVLKFSPKATVESAIRHLMDRCGAVQDDRTKGDPFPLVTAGQKYSWKVHSEISMVGAGASADLPFNQTVSNKDIVLCTYRIRRHAELTNKTIEGVLRGSDSTGDGDTITKQRIKDNLITFDYFFTGKNIDILAFDLKMDMGLAFLQTVSSTNTIGNGTSQMSGTVSENVTVVPGTELNRDSMDVSADGEKKKILIKRSRTPIFPGTNVNNVFQKNIRGALNSTLYQTMLSKHAALESVEANVTIAGNPYLMSQMNRKPSDAKSKTESGDSSDSSKIMQNMEFMPALAKINIWMPSTTDTPSSTSTFNRTKFWYDGYYYIYGIDHKFAGGEFTQDLHLLSLPQESLLLDNQQNDITECGVAQSDKQQQDTTSGGAAAGKTEPNASAAMTNLPIFRGAGGL